MTVVYRSRRRRGRQLYCSGQPEYTDGTYLNILLRNGGTPSSEERTPTPLALSAYRCPVCNLPPQDHRALHAPTRCACTAPWALRLGAGFSPPLACVPFVLVALPRM